MQRQTWLKVTMLVVAFVLVLSLLSPGYAKAADFTFNINIVRQSDGSTCGELWLKDGLLWRVAILPDGARPVSRGTATSNTTLIIPDIIKGMFVIKFE
ncbi:MAG TPA: hypothetical protein PKA28_18880 [Methylomusa anaerophila]|uniref:Uncharacterized protein n=1 Tax=Methylomusa anaerophila TaxID=1930071 RepID=A0A348AJS8_9FIRM|nr:hypothetical protein [Methylomusa anaerophila]BBB91326.1 hypothetical protein MAMMFC1_02004 [Methylomusa anaerophila]HML90499.1 hypothetical protein [Methylomusa anaerophila]